MITKVQLNSAIKKSEEILESRIDGKIEAIRDYFNSDLEKIRKDLSIIKFDLEKKENRDSDILDNRIVELEEKISNIEKCLNIKNDFKDRK